MSKTKSVLGKGLSALIPGAANDRSFAEEEKLSGIELAEVPAELRARPEGRRGPHLDAIEIARVAPNPLQPRKEFPPETLAELTQSIREHGIIQPITVRKVAGDRFELISGERRIRASIEAGLTHVPAYVIEVEGDRKMLELAIVENVQRVQLNPIEEAEAYQRLIEDCQLTQEQVAERVSKDRSTIANSIRLLKLPEPIKDSLRAGELSLGHAKVILSVDPSQQQRLWNEAIQNHYSVRKLEEVARAQNGVGKPLKKATKPGAAANVETNGYELSSDVRAIESSFQQILGTQVKVRIKPDESGEIAIQFFSHEELERLQELLATIRDI
jgi:ParB family chromosome partitioning protein